jgi:hypothetical protein
VSSSQRLMLHRHAACMQRFAEITPNLSPPARRPRGRGGCPTAQRRGSLAACNNHERTRSGDHFVIRGTVRFLQSSDEKPGERNNVTYFSAHIRFPRSCIRGIFYSDVLVDNRIVQVLYQVWLTIFWIIA